MGTLLGQQYTYRWSNIVRRVSMPCTLVYACFLERMIACSLVLEAVAWSSHFRWRTLFKAELSCLRKLSNVASWRNLSRPIPKHQFAWSSAVIRYQLLRRGFRAGQSGQEPRIHRCILHELLTWPAVSMRVDKELDSGHHSQTLNLNSLYRLKKISRDFFADPSRRDVRAGFFRSPGSIAQEQS